MATTSCEAGKVILSVENCRYHVRLQDDVGDKIGEDEYAVFTTYGEAMDQFLADSEQLLTMLNDNPGDWGGN